MARVKRAVNAHKKRREVLEQASGYRGQRSRLYRKAKEQVTHSLVYAFNDRKDRKGDFRRLWIQRINAGARANGMTYNRFIQGLKAAGVEVDRRMLAELAVNDEAAFTALVELAARTFPRRRLPEVNRKITSTKSDRVAEVRRLHERKHRQSGGAFVVEGPTNVAAAIEAKAAIHVYVTCEFRESGNELLSAVDGPDDSIDEVVTVTEAVMDAMSDTRQSQGILAVCRQVALGPTAIASDGHLIAPKGSATVGADGSWVVLDRVNDPGNAGTIIRTAEACGATAVLLTEGSVDPHNGKCVRATAGALFRVPVVTGVTWDQVRASSGRRPILATTAQGEVALGTPAADALLSQPVVWLFGTEAHGLPEEVVTAADARVRIPMPGRAESLNVAAAAAICLFEGQRHRG